MYWKILQGCDVVEMNACQIILGRPCQYDEDVVHKGRQNIFVFTWNGTNIALLPVKENEKAPKNPISKQKVLLSPS